MIRPPSIQKEYTLIYSDDPALDLPSDADEKERVLKVARETGKWPVREGEKATVFTFTPLDGVVQTYIYGEIGRRNLNHAEIAELIFRYALRRVDNFGNEKVTFEKDGNGHRRVDDKFLNVLYAVGNDAGMSDLGRTIISELGALVLMRTREPLTPL